MIAAAVCYDNRRTEIREFEMPELTSDAGLLRIELSGVCGSDWPGYQRHPKSKGPLILGHEGVGIVERVGKEAEARFGVKEGARVALEEYLPCGHCRYCRGGDYRLCDATDVFNFSDVIRYGSTPVSVTPALWGGYSQYQYLHPNAVLHPIPDHISARLATLALPLGNGFEWAYLQGGAGVGDTVVIQGAGQQGLACVVAAKEAGAGPIIVTGLSTSADKARLALALRLGADHTINVEEHDLLETVAELTRGRMADLVVDCASGGPASVVSAIQLAGKRGRVMLGGYKTEAIPEFDSGHLIRRFLTVRGMRGHSYRAVEMAIRVIASGKYPLEDMCTHVFSLSDVDEALCTVGGEGQPGAIHCAVDPWI